MRFNSAITLLLAAAGSVFAGFNPSSKSNIVLYWGQNSANQESTQNRLSYYCNEANVDVIIMSFLIQFNGEGGEPVINFANQGNYCTTFSGTNLLDCPQLAADIPTCQAAGKTILLSIGGATYTEGGYQSTAAAQAGANLIWATFGPQQSGSSALRPFGSAVVDGFDFDFESGVQHMADFANQMRSNMNAATSKKFYLSAAPQCPYPDYADSDIIANSPLDWVNVQYYNNGCGASSFVPGKPASEQWNFNFDQWDTWAKQSKNPNARVLLGVPANTGAGSGYLSPSNLQPVIQFSAQYSSFGGVMMWDASQAWQNPGFIDSVYSILAGLSSKMKVRGMRWGARTASVE